MRAIRSLLVKDIRILRRSPLTVALLVIYPLALAVLVGAVIADAGARPRVAFVDLDHLPERATIGNLHIQIGDLLRSDARLRLGVVEIHLRVEIVERRRVT